MNHSDHRGGGRCTPAPGAHGHEARSELLRKPRSWVSACRPPIGAEEMRAVVLPHSSTGAHIAAVLGLKAKVHDYWNAESCGELYATDNGAFNRAKQAAARYALEPCILSFAKFEEAKDKDVLEIGVGMGSDHVLWACAKPRRLCGIDLTSRAVNFTSERLASEGLSLQLRQVDAEALPFESERFDIVYSWGVLHHSPDTPACVREVFRVLRAGGVAIIMIYHKWSIVGLMLWSGYALLTGRLGRSLAEIYSDHLESPGTKSCTVEEARRMLRDAGFDKISVRVQLSHGDLLEGNVGARHQGWLLRMAKALWPVLCFAALRGILDFISYRDRKIEGR